MRNLSKSRKRNRLIEYDYSNSGWYFVTICVKDKIEFFGSVTDDKMSLNKSGEIVDSSWNWLSEHYGYVTLDEYVIMPNHLHGIIIIDEENTRVGGAHELSLPKKIKIKSLSELVGAFKTKSSKEIHQICNQNFKWQRSFYDRIIRNEKELYNIRKYIIQNPFKWHLEKNIINLDMF